MRLYTFINCYLSQIQQGIQTAHILGEMTKNYKTAKQERMMREYLVKDKTIIVCNGGNNSMLRDLYEFFRDQRNDFQFTDFHEDGESLDGALTGVGILLPEEIYDVKWDITKCAYVRDDGADLFITTPEDGGYEFELMQKIKSFKLA